MVGWGGGKAFAPWCACARARCAVVEGRRGGAGAQAFAPFGGGGSRCGGGWNGAGRGN
eukprot:SAG31_NODE_2725_length_5186_cov_4.147435_3_plen_58_part_00